MPTPEFGDLSAKPSEQEIVNYIQRLKKELNYILTALDVENIPRLDGKVLIDGTITKLKILAGTLTGDRLANATITSGKLSIIKLSDVSANLGTITAGTMSGLTITGSSFAGTISGSIITASTFTGTITGSEITDSTFVGIVAGSAITDPTFTGATDFTGATISGLSVTLSNHNHGISPGTTLMVDGGGTVGWASSGGGTFNVT